TAEIDSGIAAALMRAFVHGPVRISDEIDAADEESEMDAIAVPVHLGGEIGEVLPALKLRAVIERHDHELRRALDPHRGWREQARRKQHCAAEEKVACSQISPPTESDGALTLPGRRHSSRTERFAAAKIAPL